jgi:hypothetical protein
MHFHFGLGVGHVYSHYRSMQAEVQEDNAVQASHTLHGQYTRNDTINEDADEDEDEEADEDEGDSTDGELTLEQHFSSSDKSLSSQFGQMYGSDFEVDYKN